MLVITAGDRGDHRRERLLQALLAFPMMCRPWAWAFLLSGSIRASILVAIIVLLIRRSTR